MGKSKSGIYSLTNKINGKVYIGMTKDIDTRKSYHLKDLKSGKHHQRNLQNDFSEMKKLINKKYKKNPLLKYSDVNKLTFDEVYEMTIIKSFPPKYIKNNEEEIKSLEDNYILQYREAQEGYTQMTNKEIKEQWKAKCANWENDNLQKKYEDDTMKRLLTSINVIREFNDSNEIVKVDTSKLNTEDYCYLYYDYFRYIACCRNKSLDICNIDVVFNVSIVDQTLQILSREYRDYLIKNYNTDIKVNKKDKTKALITSKNKSIVNDSIKDYFPNGTAYSLEIDLKDFESYLVRYYKNMKLTKNISDDIINIINL